MRKYIFIGFIAALLFAACEEQTPKAYSGDNTIVFYSSKMESVSQVTQDYYWSEALDPSSKYDTCWLEVATMGNELPYDRELKLVQDTAIAWDYVYDYVGNLVDSTSYIIPNQAVAGRDFVPLDDEGLQPLLVMPANEFRALIPVVMIRSNATEKLTLQVRLVDTPTAKIGEPRLSTCLITIQ